MSSGSFVEITDIHKSYGKLVVLEGVNFDVRKGEFIVILGPSGEGKTTLLNIIAGVIRPDKGKVIIDGEIVDDSSNIYIPPERRDVGYVFQNYALYPHMTAFDNIAFPLKMKKLPRDEIEQRVEKIAKLLKIDHVLHHKPSQLSGGQQQRVAVARAIVKEPKLLLMDEPFSNIDPALRASVRLELRLLLKSLGITSIMATHDQEEAMTLADRLLILRRGKPIQIGSPMEVYEKPSDRFVAEFVGGMNILELKSEYSSLLREYRVEVEDVSVKFMGFRPESVIISNEGLEAEVLDAEYKGDKWTIIAQIRSGEIIRFYNKDPVNTKSTVYIKPTKIYLFSSEGKTVKILTINK